MYCVGRSRRWVLSSSQRWVWTGGRVGTPGLLVGGQLPPAGEVAGDVVPHVGGGDVLQRRPVRRVGGDQPPVQVKVGGNIPPAVVGEVGDPRAAGGRHRPGQDVTQLALFLGVDEGQVP